MTQPTDDKQHTPIPMGWLRAEAADDSRLASPTDMLRVALTDKRRFEPATAYFEQAAAGWVHDAELIFATWQSLPRSAMSYLEAHGRVKTLADVPFKVGPASYLPGPDAPVSPTVAEDVIEFTIEHGYSRDDGSGLRRVTGRMGSVSVVVEVAPT